MHSLRKKLLIWLLALHAIVAIVAMTWMHSTFGAAVNAYLDDQLRVFAESHAAAGAPLRALPALTTEDVHEGAFIAQIWDRSARLATSSWTAVDLPRQSANGFHVFETPGARWRAYTVLTPDRTVQVVQALDFRERAVWRQSLRSATPVLALLPLSALLLWWGLASVSRLHDAPLTHVHESATNSSAAAPLAAPEAPRVPVSLHELLQESVAAFMPMAERRQVDLGYAASIAALVQGERDDLRLLIHQLLDNALRYTPEGGVVDVALHNDHGVLAIEIIDNGPGMAVDELQRMFDELLSVDSAQPRGGLALAKHAAERNQVALELMNRLDGPGLIARMRFNASSVLETSALSNAGADWRRSEASTPEVSV